MTTIERPFLGGESDLPIGLGRGRFPESNANIEFGSPEDLSLDLDQPRNQRLLPPTVEMRVRHRGDTLSKGLVAPEAFLGDLARKWRDLLRDPSPAVAIGMSLSNPPVPVLVLRRAGITLTLSVTRDRVTTLVRVPFGTALEVLEEFGHAIAVRLPAECDAVRAWRGRLPRDRGGLATMDAELLDLPRDMIGRLDFEPVTDAQSLAFPGDIRMAARLAYTPEIEVDALQDALEAIRSHPPIETPRLDELCGEALSANTLELDGGLRPFEQGHAVAKWLRTRLALPEDRVDIEGMLEDWGVAMDDIDLGTPFIDAIAAWGDHGPVIVVNRMGRRSSSLRGRRATLAHELCHLLIDRSGALPVAEAQGTKVRTDSDIEARANAFGAELLLPRDVAARTLRLTGDIGETVNKLMARFDVSRLLALRQMSNCPSDVGGPLPEQKREILRLIDESERAAEP